MRKGLAILLALAVLISLTACGGNDKAEETVPQSAPTEVIPVTEESVTLPDPPAPEVGYWEMIRIDSDNVSVAATEEEVEKVKAEGIPLYLELLQDGTGTFCLEDEMAVTWEAGSFTVMEEETFTYELDGNRMMLDLREMTIICRRTEKPGSRASELEDAGFTEYMEEWVTYPYTTICSDDASLTTTGEATVIAYEIFESDEGYPYKEGYEWRVATIEVRFFDENAQKYGPYAFTRHEDYYDVKLHDDSEVVLDEGEDCYAYTHTRVWLGQEVETYLRSRDSWSSWRKNSSGNYEVFYNVEFAFQVPEGYNGAVACLENGAYEYPEDSYLTDCEPEYFLLFRLD